MMDAPTYPPAVAYAQPSEAPYQFGLRTISIAELMAWPAAWALVVKYLPAATMMVSSEAFKPNAGNMTLLDLKTFVGNAMDTQLDTLDIALKSLPASGRPAL